MGNRIFNVHVLPLHFSLQQYAQPWNLKIDNVPCPSCTHHILWTKKSAFDIARNRETNPGLWVWQSKGPDLQSVCSHWRHNLWRRFAWDSDGRAIGLRECSTHIVKEMIRNRPYCIIPFCLGPPMSPHHPIYMMLDKEVHGMLNSYIVFCCITISVRYWEVNQWYWRSGMPLLATVVAFIVYSCFVCCWQTNVTEFVPLQYS